MSHDWRQASKAPTLDAGENGMLTSIVLLGFVLGLQHAFEADHLAAVSALVSRRSGLREITRHGALWGLGHSLALLSIGSFVLLTPWVMPAGFETALETLVGGLLVVLGSQLLIRLWRDRVHVHAHRHDGEVHLHAHSHRLETVPHEESEHDHRHPKADWKTLLVGLAHGAAGSAALTVFVAAGLDSISSGLLYIALFGLGSILGMTALTAVIALPLTVTARGLTWANWGLQIVIGVASISLGFRWLLLQGLW